MKIKLLHAVMHDGYRVEAGEVGDIDEAIAKPLIASGAAEEVAEDEPAQPVDLPERPLVPETNAGTTVPATATAPAGDAATVAETTPATPIAEDTSAETGKAAKTKGSK